MPRRGNAKLASMGKAIIARAKAIRKAHPTKKWTACMKEAGSELRGKL